MDDHTDRAFTRAERLSRISTLLHAAPHGLSTAELARLCGVSQRTIQRDLVSLETLGIPVTESGEHPPRYTMVEGCYIPPVRLSLHEALALYLAARLLARHADRFDPHMAAALAKLAAVLPAPMSAHVQATVQAMATRPEDANQVQVLGRLALGWANRRRVRIRYRAARSANVHSYVLCPYVIEPAPSGGSTYVIGHASWFDAIRTFKVERILEAELLTEGFDVPTDLDAPALLAGAWGVWWGAEEQEVLLRFAPGVATRRVQETIWHPSQELAEEPDEGCTLRVRVAEPREMVPWIRGWGPQVEVLAPAWLREQVAREAEETARVYGGRP
jgi:predicted DNA-binding transcriptional regulator YafY